MLENMKSLKKEIKIKTESHRDEIHNKNVTAQVATTGNSAV